MTTTLAFQVAPSTQRLCLSYLATPVLTTIRTVLPPIPQTGRIAWIPIPAAHQAVHGISMLFPLLLARIVQITITIASQSLNGPIA